VIEIEGERGVDVGKSDGGHVRHDLIGSHPLMLMPHHDVEHANSMAGNAGLAAANAGRPCDPILCGRRHDSSISRYTPRRLPHSITCSRGLKR
jgi:hypothetical protein